MPKYTKEDEKVIRDGFADPNTTIKEVAIQLNRVPSLISIKAKKMGLKKVMKHHSKNGWRCSSCGTKLVKNINWAPSYYRRKRYTCAKCVREKNAAPTNEVRLKVIQLFGGVCEKCGYDKDWRALQIDHVKGGGRKDISQYRGVKNYYNHLLSLPEKELKQKYQLLCANCNRIKMYENNEFRSPTY